jgi:hypothetical protein
MRKVVHGAIAAVALLAGVARAHEDGVHARGVVKEITAERIVVATADGKATPFALGPETKILRGKDSVAADAVRPGERAVVHASRKGGRLEATEVKLGPAKK